MIASASEVIRLSPASCCIVQRGNQLNQQLVLLAICSMTGLIQPQSGWRIEVWSLTTATCQSGLHLNRLQRHSYSILWCWSPPVSRCCVENEVLGGSRIDLAVTHQDIHLCACVWLSRGSVTDGKCMIHADVPGWCSGRQRSILLLGAFSHQRAFMTKWNIYTHTDPTTNTHYSKLVEHKTARQGRAVSCNLTQQAQVKKVNIIHYCKSHLAIYLKHTHTHPHSAVGRGVSQSLTAPYFI